MIPARRLAALAAATAVLTSLSVAGSLAAQATTSDSCSTTGTASAAANSTGPQACSPRKKHKHKKKHKKKAAKPVVTPTASPTVAPTVPPTTAPAVPPTTAPAVPTVPPTTAPTVAPTQSAASLAVTGFATLAGGTTGGAAGPTVTVTTLGDLQTYAGAAEPYVIKISGVIPLSGQVKVESNKTIIGADAVSGLSGGGLAVRKVDNVIIENLTISKVVGADGVTIWGSSHVFVSHNDFSSDRDHGKDYYDGLVDVTKGSDFVTVSYNRFHDHYKVILIGASDDDGAVDTGKLHVSVDHNSFARVGSRLPSIRFGTAHVYNNTFTDVATSAIHSRMGAQVLAQNNVFRNVKNAYVTHADSVLDGTITVDPTPAPDWAYSYTLTPAADVPAVVSAQAGPQ
jgi:pectate lyase